jgi:beta-glucanase (GH16 family)
MKLLSALLPAALLAASCATGPAPASDTDWTLIWSDEFNTPGAPDWDKWTALEWGPRVVNDERQAYTDSLDTARVEGGRLLITAIRGGENDYPYQSARLTTEDKFSFLYGKVEFRAKLPRGRGTWPALWMMPEDYMGYGRGWPDSGEIDVMEHVGFDPGVIHASTHTGKYNWPAKTQKTATQTLSNPFDEWHTYGVEWSAEGLRYTIDGSTLLTFRNEHTDWKAWPFDKPFHLIMNVAVGGNWGGQNGIDDKAFPATMQVDWVRVYQKRP